MKRSHTNSFSSEEDEEEYEDEEDYEGYKSKDEISLKEEIIEVEELTSVSDVEFKIPEIPKINTPKRLKELPKLPKEKKRKRKSKDLPPGKIKARQVINSVMHYHICDTYTDGTVVERWLPVFDVEDFEDVIRFEKFMAKVEFGSEEDIYNPQDDPFF